MFGDCILLNFTANDFTLEGYTLSGLHVDAKNALLGFLYLVSNLFFWPNQIAVFFGGGN